MWDIRYENIILNKLGLLNREPLSKFYFPKILKILKKPSEENYGGKVAPEETN